MAYEPRLPRLLDELAKRGEEHTSHVVHIGQAIHQEDAQSHTRACLSEDVFTAAPAAAPPLSTPLCTLSPPEAVTAVTDDLLASAARLEQRHVMVKFWVPDLREALWMVSSQDEVALLVREGIRESTIWTVRELVPLLQAPGMIHEDALAPARLRQVFNATVVDILSAQDVVAKRRQTMLGLESQSVRSAQENDPESPVRST